MSFSDAVLAISVNVCCQNLSSDIDQWRPLVADIRSSMTGVAQQTTDTELMCERISLAVKRWDDVCDASDAALLNISNWLLISDSFPTSIDNVLAKMDEVRDDIVDIDLGRNVLHQTVDEKQARLLQLTVCISWELLHLITVCWSWALSLASLCGLIVSEMIGWLCCRVIMMMNVCSRWWVSLT